MACQCWLMKLIVRVTAFTTLIMFDTFYTTCFGKGIYYHPYYLFWHWFTSFRYYTAHCKSFAEVTGLQTFNDGITSKYIWISGILRNVMLCIELIKYISYFLYMDKSKEESLRNINVQHATTITITERKLISTPSKPV